MMNFEDPNFFRDYYLIQLTEKNSSRLKRNLREFCPFDTIKFMEKQYLDPTDYRDAHLY
jgi:hypothetical protein